MRLGLWIWGREVLALQLTRAYAPEAGEYVALGGTYEETVGDDGKRYAPSFSEDDCFEPEDRPFRMGFAGGL